MADPLTIETTHMADSQEVRELLDMARDRSVGARMRLVDKIGDVFSERETVLSERERALMTDILEKLVKDFETAVRSEIAKRLADKPAAPADLVTMLANDAIEVARPILMESRVLQDRHLIEVIQNRGRQHQLAIAMRRSISAPVADALVETDDDDVIATLLNNRTATISEATKAYLIDQARHRDSFLEPMVGRQDLTPDLVRKLYLMVSAALRQRILETYDVDTNALDDVIESVAVEADGASASALQTQSTADPARQLAERIAAEQTIDGRLLVKVLRQGEVRLFEALFAVISGIQAPRLQHVLYETGGRGLAAACKAVEIDKTSFTSVYLLSRKDRLGDQPVDPAELHRVIRFFDGLNIEAAREALRHWRRDPAYLEAIDALAAESSR
jgi:uncharacterized protein (DUF2336 family)